MIIAEDEAAIVNRVALANNNRAELITQLAGKLSVEDRVRVQGELSVVNAQIKALNTMRAARLKAAADRRRATGVAEAQTNAARARARLHEPGAASELAPDDPTKTAAIDAWIIAVLRRGGLKVSRARDGNLDILDAPAKWVGITEALCDGIYAAARGEELPEVTAAPTGVKRRP